MNEENALQSYYLIKTYDVIDFPSSGLISMIHRNWEGLSVCLNRDSVKTKIINFYVIPLSTTNPKSPSVKRPNLLPIFLQKT